MRNVKILPILLYITLSEMHQSQKTSHPLRCGKQIPKGRRQSPVCQGLGRGEDGKPLFKGASVNIVR